MKNKKRKPLPKLVGAFLMPPLLRGEGRSPGDYLVMSRSDRGLVHESYKHYLPKEIKKRNLLLNKQRVENNKSFAKTIFDLSFKLSDKEVDLVCGIAYSHVILPRELQRIFDFVLLHKKIKGVEI